MKENRFRRVIEQGGTPAGHMLMEFGTRGIARILAAADMDFVVVDMEHTGFDSERIADLMAWLKATDIAPFVRVPQGLYHFLARTLDAGALGVMVGNVETPEQAKTIVDAVKFAPLGHRGVGLGTAHTDYVVPDPAAYFEYSNRNTTVICQIESVSGLSNAGRIAGTPGVDVLWVGHYDLSQSMGIPGQFQHPRFVEGLRSVIDAANQNGILAAIQPSSLPLAEQMLDLGFHFLSWSIDIHVYREALRKDMAEIRRLSAEAKKSVVASRS